MKNKKILKAVAAVVAIALAGVVLFYVNGLFGNPVSRTAAKLRAESYIAAQYAGLDLTVEDSGYDFKMGCYTVDVQSPESDDVHFPLYYDSFGRLNYDGYENFVLSGRNTTERLADRYRYYVELVLRNEPFFSSFGDKSFWFGTLSEKIADYEINQPYNTEKIGAESGKLVIVFDSPEATVKDLAAALVEIKEIFNRNNVPFYCVDLSMGDYYLEDFLYADIEQPGMEEKIAGIIAMQSDTDKEAPIE